MVSQKLLAIVSLAGAASAQVFWPYPEDMTGKLCDGLVRPDYDECDKELNGWLNSKDVMVGPEFNDGTVFTGKKCQVRFVECSNKEKTEAWELDKEMAGSLVGLVRNECGKDMAGGIQRQGDVCAMVEDPKNKFAPKLPDDKKRKTKTKRHPAAAAMERFARSTDARTNKQARRSLVNEARGLEERQCDAGEKCATYKEQSFSTNIRGDQTKICDNVLKDGGKCSKSKAVTVSESYSLGSEVSAGLKDVVDVSASFTSTFTEGVTETVTTDITIDCPGGSGYIVWYPLMEVSRGECGFGETTCGAGCSVEKMEKCEIKRPIQQEEGVISGEYDFICI